MNNLLKNRMVIVFVIFVLSITYIDSMKEKRMMEENTKLSYDNYISMNVK